MLVLIGLVDGHCLLANQSAWLRLMSMLHSNINGYTNNNDSNNNANNNNNNKEKLHFTDRLAKLK